MFIHEMTKTECDDALMRAQLGRLACTRNDQPYIVPLNFAFDGDAHIYGFTTFGMKIEWMRANPKVCFEIDEVRSHNDWTSVIVFGRYEELPDQPEFAAARARAYSFIQKRTMWWEPAYISQAHRDHPHSLTPNFFRIHIEEITGHRATSDAAAAAPPRSEVETRATGRQTASLLGRSINVLKAALAYFAIVFATGLVLGPVRVLLVAPRLGERLAELLELPLMIVVIVLAARWIVGRFQLPADAISRLGTGLIALGLGLVFEFTLVLKLRGITLEEYFATRDPVSGTAYHITLILFGLMPLLARLPRKT